jgi:phospholysine phosphohistidine inorganic pyrophosphate phosphatase
MRGVLIDLDGVIWESDQVVHGAPATVDWLNDHAIPHLFVTNTTSRPVRLIVDKLERLGIRTTKDKLLTPPLAACDWLAANASGPTALLVPEATLEDFSAIQSGSLDNDDDLAAIVVGDIGAGWTYELLNNVFRRLMDKHPPQLIALGMTRYWRAADGLRLDVAPFIKALEHAAGCESIVLGKPSKAFFDIALGKIGCKAIDTTMVGDDLFGDVLGAQEAGMQGFLTRTGKFRPEDMEAGVLPDALLDSIADLPNWLH